MTSEFKARRLQMLKDAHARVRARMGKDDEPIEEVEEVSEKDFDKFMKDTDEFIESETAIALEME